MNAVTSEYTVNTIEALSLRLTNKGAIRSEMLMTYRLAI